MEQLLKNISYHKLYAPEQNIWFLIWILKKHDSYQYLNKIILKMPFSIKIKINDNTGELCSYVYLKNGLKHGHGYSRSYRYLSYRKIEEEYVWKNDVLIASYRWLDIDESTIGRNHQGW